MAFLSHSIPWSSLASMFEYRPARSGPGPQASGLHAKDQPNKRKQVEHFALKFQSIVREHSVIERKKYRPAKDYVKRARTWTESDDAPLSTSTDEFNSPEDDRPNVLELAAPKRPKRDDEYRHGQANLINAWPTADPETRLVYPAEFSTLYIPYTPRGSGGAYGVNGLVEDFAYIETWIDVRRRQKLDYADLSEGERNALWLDERCCSDIIKLLVIDASTTQDEQRRRGMLENVFLLAHHPDVGLDSFLFLGMSCCNINPTIMNLVEKVLMVFIYLNLIQTYLDSGVTKLTEPCDDDDEAYEPPHYRRHSTFVSLVPRPAYMYTADYNMILTQALNDHGHMVEHVFFTPLFAPYKNNVRYPEGKRNSEKRYERDIFADPVALRAAMKSMWKMLVYCDMVLADNDPERPINWEYAVLQCLAELFHSRGGIDKLLGERWLYYEMNRQSANGDGEGRVSGKFCFFRSAADDTGEK